MELVHERLDLLLLQQRIGALGRQCAGTLPRPGAAVLSSLMQSLLYGYRSDILGAENAVCQQPYLRDNRNSRHNRFQTTVVMAGDTQEMGWRTSIKPEYPLQWMLAQ